jgi:hypothetical protein
MSITSFFVDPRQLNFDLMRVKTESTEGVYPLILLIDRKNCTKYNWLHHKQHVKVIDYFSFKILIILN